MQLDPKEVEELAKTLYVRALKLLPPDIKRGFERLVATETDATGRTILGTMVENIAVAERTNNLLCQDTGIPIYNVTIGRNVEVDGVAMKEAIRRGCERATREHPLRSSVVHPLTRRNEQTSCGERIPIIHIDFDGRDETVEIEMIPKGSGSENGSFLQMLIPADGAKAVKRFVIDKVIECGGRVCPPTIVGVGIGGTSDLCMHLAKLAATRPLGTACGDPEGAKIEAELSEAVNELGIGPQGLGGRSTSFRVHVEIAATHITMNPVAVNIQCHSARRANAIITPGGIAFNEGAMSDGPRRNAFFSPPPCGEGEGTTMTHHTLDMPITEEQARALRVGDTVTLEQRLFGIRDATLIHMFDRGRTTRFDLKGHAVIHTAPNVRRVDGYPDNAPRYTPLCIGTTTSQRMERFTAPLMTREGVRLIIGKGGMGEGTLKAFREIGGAYLAVVGGAAALETTWIEEIEDVDLDDLHPESLWQFRIRGFGPLLVTMDSHGGSLHAQVLENAAAKRAAILASIGAEE